jgi:hypothetical protein
MHRMTQPTPKILLALLTLATMTGAASAQSPTRDEIGTCGGILHRDKSRLFVGDPKTETAEDLPCFITQSDVKKVLSVCALGRWCEVAGVIDGNCEPGKCEISKVVSVSRSTEQPPARVVNEAVVRKLCPNPNAKCMARDNPDFYKDADPAFYNRITKPTGSR